MAQFFQIHPDNPQQRLIRQAVDVVRNGGIIVYPTDSGYALGCDMSNKRAKDRIRQPSVTTEFSSDWVPAAWGWSIGPSTPACSGRWR